jgi:hypothetical protein
VECLGVVGVGSKGSRGAFFFAFVFENCNSMLVSLGVFVSMCKM